MALSGSQVVLYAADGTDLGFCVGAAAAVGIPLGNVVGNFESAWEFTASGDYLVIAVGGQANNALYYNECGWANPAGEAGGNTPFSIAAGPRDTLPGANLYVNAAGGDAQESLYLAAAYAHYALHGSYPSEWASPPTPSGPSVTCAGSANVACPCAGTYYGGDSCCYQSVSCGSYAFYGKPTGAGGAGNQNGPACTCSTCLSSGATIYSVWGLKGPGAAPSGQSASTWGAAQASAAVSEWKSDSQVHDQLTIFFDVESAEGGWGTNQTANQEVLEAALNGIFSAGLDLNPGVYISLGTSDNKWDTYFGSGYKPSTPFVLWGALHECYSCSEAASLWPNYYGDTPIVAGGQRLVIAQYAVAGTGCTEVCSGTTADLDFMIQDPGAHKFSPVPF